MQNLYFTFTQGAWKSNRSISSQLCKAYLIFDRMFIFWVVVLKYGKVGILRKNWYIFEKFVESWGCRYQKSNRRLIIIYGAWDIQNVLSIFFLPLWTKIGLPYISHVNLYYFSSLSCNFRNSLGAMRKPLNKMKTWTRAMQEIICDIIQFHPRRYNEGLFWIQLFQKWNLSWDGMWQSTCICLMAKYTSIRKKFKFGDGRRWAKAEV